MRAVHTNVGGDPAQNNRVDPATAQLELQVGAVECAPLAFGDFYIAVAFTERDRIRPPVVRQRLREGILPFAGGPHTADDVVSRAARLAEKCRASGSPVVMVRGGWSADFAEGLKKPGDAQGPAQARPPVVRQRLRRGLGINRLF